MSDEQSTQARAPQADRAAIEREIEGLHEREGELSDHIGRAVLQGAGTVGLRAERRDVRDRLEDLYAALGQLDMDRYMVSTR